jgi:hypothetical protein
MQLTMPLATRIKTSKLPGSTVIGFKCDADSRAKLDALAKNLGVSRNILARDFVLKALNEPADLFGAVMTLNQQMLALREELALIAEVLLTHAGKVDEEDAKKWTDENIKPV